MLERDASLAGFAAGRGAELPLVVEAGGDPDVGRLVARVREASDLVDAAILRHGALLFRGFDVRDVHDFEAVVRAIDPNLRNDYLGTRTGIDASEHVFLASDVPGGYPIGQHCEMSFLRQPPARIFFGCLQAPRGGETPLADFRKVWRDLDPDVRARLEQRGIRIVRNLRGPRSRWPRLWTLERWHAIFHTENRAAIEAACAREGIAVEWTADDGLRLSIPHPVRRDHPRTGEPVWYNQFSAHHVATSVFVYPKIFRLRPSLWSWAFWQLERAVVALKRRSPPGTLSFYTTHADGGPVADSDMRALWDTIWKHMVIVPWRRGDVMAVDNYAISHGRLPFRGPRRIVACLA